jgi:hypothetical protein
MSPGARRSRIEELLAKAGEWTDDEIREIERMTGRDPDDYPSVEDRERRRKRSFEIEGEWSDPKPERTLSLDTSGPAGTVMPPYELERVQRPAPASEGDRLERLERSLEIIWKAIHALEARLGVGKE